MENEVQKKRILSGIQPSGDLTLGSYLGAIRNWAALADEYDCYYMMADMHTITVRQVPAELRRHTLVQLAAYIAENAIMHLDAPVVRVATPDCPIPFAPVLEEYLIPSAERIAEEARKLARL